MKASLYPTGCSLSFDSGRVPDEKRLSEALLKDYVKSGVTYLEVSLTEEVLAKTYFMKNPELYGEYCIRSGEIGRAHV